MNSRSFITTAGGFVMRSSIAGCMDIKPVYRKFSGKIKSWFAAERSLSANRLPMEFPTEGAAVSVEKALNSRCFSDFDGDPGINHWGVADAAHAFSESQIRQITSLIQCPRFSATTSAFKVDKNRLVFYIDEKSLIKRSRRR